MKIEWLKCSRRLTPHFMQDVPQIKLPYNHPIIVEFDNYTRVNNTFANELFTLLKCDLFLKDNTLPKSMYQAKKVVW
jgi:hypothetical protein